MRSVATIDRDHVQTRGCPVCVVDDEQGVRELICALCASAGLAVEGYDSAESFLSAYACEPIKARCLVLDFNLPGMSGIELVTKLNAQGLYLPVLLISGVAENETVVQGLKLGIAGFFRKPFENQAVLRRILDLVGRHGDRDPPGTGKGNHQTRFQPIFFDD